MKDVLIDTASVPHNERHAHIFKVFDSLETGDSMTILNNHDPKPLLVQLNEIKGPTFSSEYLVNGPSEWKVKLTKKMKEGCCGCC